MKRFFIPLLAALALFAPVEANWIFNKRSSEKCNNQRKFSFIDLSKRSKESVVVISSNKNTGSGFVVRHDKGNTFIITNSHVIDGNKKVIISWGDGKEDVGKVVKDSLGESNQRDLALIKVDGIEGQVLPLDTKKLEVGSEVIAVGAPEGLNFSFTRGIISGLRGNESLVQTDAAINPGNSGGPLITRNGCVVGINTFIIEETEGLNFAISSNVINKFIKNFTFERVTKKNKNFKKDYLYRAKALSNVDGQEFKIMALTTLSLLEKETANAYKLRAFAKAKTSYMNTRGLIEDINWVLNNNPQDSQSLLLRAHFLSNLTSVNFDKNSLALDDYDKVIALSGEEKALAFMNRGLFRIVVLKDSDGLMDVNRAIELDPKNRHFYLVRGTFYNSKLFAKNLVNNEKAILDFETALKLKDEKPISNFAFEDWLSVFSKNREVEPYLQLGRINSNLDIFKAIKLYSEGIKIDPNEKYLYRNRAYLYRELKNYRAAIKDYLVAIKINEAENDKQAISEYYYVGGLYEKIGDYKKAIDFYSKYIMKHNTNGYVYQMRAYATDKISGKGSGCFDHKRALDLGADKGDSSYKYFVERYCK